MATPQRFVLANGIAATSDRRTFFVADSATRLVHVLQRSESGRLEPVGVWSNTHPTKAVRLG